MEVYIGIYLLITLFLGWTSLITVIVYWQLLRIKSLISYNTKAAFTRIDNTISGYLNRPACPGIIRLVYEKIKGVISYFGRMDDPAQ